MGVADHGQKGWQGGVVFFQKGAISRAAIHDVVAEAPLEEALGFADDAG